MLKPILINFQHWQNLMDCDEGEILYANFWFFEVMNRLCPKIYNKIND